MVVKPKFLHDILGRIATRRHPGAASAVFLISIRVRHHQYQSFMRRRPTRASAAARRSARPTPPFVFAALDVELVGLAKQLECWELGDQR